jgi:hypothetical protein
LDTVEPFCGAGTEGFALVLGVSVPPARLVDPVASTLVCAGAGAGEAFLSGTGDLAA